MYSHQVKHMTSYKNVDQIQCACCEDIYWPAMDVCKLLEIDDADRAIKELNADDKNEMVFYQGEDDLDSSESDRMDVVNVYGVFALMLQSEAPIAKELKRWITNDVLFEILVGEGMIHHIDFSIKEKLEEMGLLPCWV